MKRKKDDFKLDNHINWYLRDYEGNVEKQRKIVERTSGELFYVFKPLEEKEDGRTLGES